MRPEFATTLAFVALFPLLSSAQKFVILDQTTQARDPDDKNYYAVDNGNSEPLYVPDHTLNYKFEHLDLQKAMDSFFNFTGVATTPLGRVSAWAGDLAYPVLITGACVLAFFVVFQIISQTVGLALDTKTTVLSSLFGLLKNSNNDMVKRFVSVASNDEVIRGFLDNPAGGRTGRRGQDDGFLSQDHLVQILSGVYTAIEKYQE